LHALPQLDIIDEIENVERTTDVFQFPQGLLGLILAGIAAQLAHNCGLCHILLRKGHHDALNVGPLLFYQIAVRLARRLDDSIIVVAGVPGTDQGLKRSMRQTHIAGEKLFVDYAGPTVPIIDATTGEISKAQIFVATFGASNYTYACSTARQTTADWIGGNTK